MKILGKEFDKILAKFKEIHLNFRKYVELSSSQSKKAIKCWTSKFYNSPSIETLWDGGEDL